MVKNKYTNFVHVYVIARRKAWQTHQYIYSFPAALADLIEPFSPVSQSVKDLNDY